MRPSYKIIKAYLVAIDQHHIEHDFQDPKTDDSLQLVCRGIHHQQGEIQLPITLNILRTLKEQLRQYTYAFKEKAMLWAAFDIFIYGYVSEYVNLHWCGVSYCTMKTTCQLP